MRNQLLPAVLFLFLLVPALITRAQITKSISGTVTWQSGMSQTTFETPKGKVVVSLPQDFSGKVFTGSVTAEPSGKNEKEKRKNMIELLQYSLNLDGQRIPLTESPRTFDWLAHMDRSLRTPLELLNVSGVKVGEASLPGVLPLPTINPNIPARLSSLSKVLIKGDYLNIYTNKTFDAAQNFTITDARGQHFTLKPLCQSSQQAIVKLPEEIAIGPIRITPVPETGNVEQPGRSPSLKLNLIDMNISSPKTNLKTGERSYVQVQVTTGQRDRTNPQGPVFATIIDPKITEKDTAEAMQIPVMSIDLRNLNPQIVTMEGGNLQRIPIQQQADSGKDAQTDGLMIMRYLMGQSTGVFSVSATLHEDYNTSTDPFRPQLNVLQTPEDYNTWAEALKKDLRQLASGSPDVQANIRRAIDNLPVCNGPNNLSECKAVASLLLQPLNIPKGAAINFLSSYEAAKAASKAIDNNLSGTTELLDYDVMRNGVDVINRVAAKNNKPLLKALCERLDQLLEEGSSSNLKELKNQWDAVRSMVNAMEGNWNYSPSWSDLVLASYQLPTLAQPGLVHPFNDLVASYNPLSKTIYFLPDYKNQIFERIKPHLRADGKYDVTFLDPNRKPIQTIVDIVSAPPIVLYDVTKQDSTKNIDEEGFESTGELIGKKWDSATGYKFYKNAKCTRWKEAHEGECMPNYKYDANGKLVVDEKGNLVESGTSHKISTTGESHCYKGTEFCTEMYIVAIIEYQYDDRNCKRLLKVTTLGGWSCE